VVPDIYADPRVLVDAYLPTFVHSLVMVPIRRAAPLGAIGNYWSAHHAATPEEVELLQALADTTAVALENVQVYAELEQRVRDRTRELAAAHRELDEWADLLAGDEERQSLLEAASIAKVVPWKRELPSRTWVFGDSAARVLGYGPDQFRREPDLVERLIHTEDVHRFVAAQKQCQAGKAVGFDCRMRHQDGSWVWTRWTMAMSPGRLWGVLQDVSELHATQEQLILSQKAEATGVMVSGLCHDFSNHISAILGFADMIGAFPLDESQRRNLVRLNRAAERSRDLARQLLSFARKNQQVLRSPQDLNALAEEAAGLLKHALGRGVDLELELAPALPPVTVEPGQMVQLVLNLGVNAVDAVAGAGTITLRTGSEDLDRAAAEAYGRAPGRYLFLEVEDTGPGIPEAVQGRIFEPFFTTKAGGTGLGLAMVQAIVKGHDGIPLCFSEPGKGARFRILLPGPDCI
jgi:signal transduction histidine kinase